MHLIVGLGPRRALVAIDVHYCMLYMKVVTVRRESPKFWKREGR
jgi:hypothetical protein